MTTPKENTTSAEMDGVERPSKRQRVSRACTNCRRRKTRCDGNDPCDSCQISNLTCSYDGAGRLSSTEYIQSLEKKVEELERLLGRPGTSLSLSSPGDDATVKPGSEYGSPLRADHDVIETMVDAHESGGDPHATPRSTPHQERDPHDFGGLSLLRRVHKLCKHVSGLKQDGGRADDDLTTGFEIAAPESDASVSWEAFTLLPARATVDRAIDVVVDEACCNMQFLDREMLRRTADDVFEEGETANNAPARKPLALIYAILALSRLFHPEERPPNGRQKVPSPSGLRYFRASRSLLDPASCQEMVALRTLLCMVLYTGAASMMSTCYSYICMAVAASLQMGLFTDRADKDLMEHEIRERRIIYAVLSIADTYITTALGLPRTLRDIEPERALPSAISITSAIDPIFGTYMHAQLIQILAMTVESNHPFTRPIERKNGTYGVEYYKIVATEERLEGWYNQLVNTPSADDSAVDGGLMRSQLLLRLYYAHVQMVLYRPFLHHALKDTSRASRTSLKAYACGSACIKASMQAVWLVEKLEASHLFNPAQWFVSFVITFTAAILSLFVTSDRGAPTVEDMADALQRIKGLCTRHAHHSDSLRRCLRFLESLPPHGPDMANDGAADLWNSFAQNTSSFAEAFRAADELSPEGMQGEDMLQALSLPQLQSFLNARL